MAEPTLNDIFDNWFVDNKNECWRDRRTNKIICYFNKEKQKELLEKAPDVTTTD